MSNIINNAADCNIKQFMACAFDNKYRPLLIDGEATDDELRKAFEYIHDQYIDYSGLYQSREFELGAYIHSLNVRVTTVAEFVILQRRFIDEFRVPYVAAFWQVKKYGHTLYWNHDFPDIGLFLARLSKIELKEARYKSEVKMKEKDLFELRRKKIEKEFTLLESRKQFLLTLARLQQAKYVISKTETMMDELSYMIKEMRDAQQEDQAQKSFQKRKK